MSVAAGVHVAEGIDCKEEWYSNAFDFGDAISEVLEKHEATSTYPHIQPKVKSTNPSLHYLSIFNSLFTKYFLEKGFNNPSLKILLISRSSLKESVSVGMNRDQL